MSLPLLDLCSRPEVNRRDGLASAVAGVDVDELAAAYRDTVSLAPRRRAPYLVATHDGAGGASNFKSEKVLAKAIFNADRPLQVGDRHVQIIDYEVPLRDVRADAGVGEIDLLGVEVQEPRLWIIELKVHPNSDTPLKALLQALRYSAILEANSDKIASEVFERRGVRVEWPASIAVAADGSYWTRLADTVPAGESLVALRRLSMQVTKRLSIPIHLVDLGNLVAEMGANQRVLLRDPLTVETL
ncbi:MAG: hypothetical protein WD184_05345 [Acidimicrobiia bacterium]